MHIRGRVHQGSKHHEYAEDPIFCLTSVQKTGHQLEHMRFDERWWKLLLVTGNTCQGTTNTS